MAEKQFLNITPQELLNRVSDLWEQGCRLIQICCSSEGDGYEIDYSFDRSYTFIDLKMRVGSDTEIPSISLVFPPAFIYENEIESLFGLKILHKSVDFGGKMYQTARPAPFANVPKEEN